MRVAIARALRSAVVSIVFTTSLSQAIAADARRERFGELDGKPVEAVAFSNAHGLRARVIAYGATLQELQAPDRQGQLADVVLAYSAIQDYVQKPQYFGATVGRYGNRIAGASITLDGRTYALSKNDGPNHLHGGAKGFDKVLWTLEDVSSGSSAAATFSYVSPDGDQGFPGTLTVKVTYSLDDLSALTIRYEARTTQPTFVNLTNHSLFNLAGAASGRDILGQRLTIAASKYTPVDSTLIPTGELKSVAGGAFDFRKPRLIGERIHEGSDPQLVIGRGYDHNFVIDAGVTADPKFIARLEDPASGRVMEIFSTEPGVQVYSGNFLNGTVVGKGRQIYRQAAGLALEPQRYPDSPHHESFPSTRLDPGQTYRHVSVYRFGATP